VYEVQDRQEKRTLGGVEAELGANGRGLGKGRSARIDVDVQGDVPRITIGCGSLSCASGLDEEGRPRLQLG
jgi:hypothetical protein